MNNADSYLRKTLEQVLDLKTQLEKANTTTLTLKGHRGGVMLKGFYDHDSTT